MDEKTAGGEEKALHLQDTATMHSRMMMRHGRGTTRRRRVFGIIENNED